MCDCLHFDFAAGISATSEDIPNKIEDLRSECSSDFGGKDSVTSPDGEEAGHGRRHTLWLSHHSVLVTTSSSLLLIC